MANHETQGICPLCRSSSIGKVLSVEDYRIAKEQFYIFECNVCSMRFTTPVPNEVEIQKYYDAESYISHSEKADTLFDKIYKIVQKITLNSKRRIVKKYSSVNNGSILDFGCGTGDFLNKMKFANWQVEGVDINESARQLAQNKIGKTIIKPKDFLENDNKYDVITMWHSVEHLHNLLDYVSKIINSLSENGVLLIAVPNYKSFDAEFYNERWAAYDAPRHLYHFSFQAMQKLVDLFNMNIVHYQQLPFDPFYISLMSETNVKSKGSIIRALWIGLRSFVKGTFNPKKGSSILYVMKFDKE